jgi:hypothetical protein
MTHHRAKKAFPILLSIGLLAAAAVARGVRAQSPAQPPASTPSQKPPAAPDPKTQSGQAAKAPAPQEPPPPPATVDGIVFDAVSGKPLKKALVLAQRAGARGPAGPMSLQCAQSSADGRFSLTLGPGAYTLRVTRNGYLEQSYGQTYPTKPPGTLTLAAAQHVNDLTFRLMPMAVLTGRVHDEDGEPLRNVSVQALRRSYGNGRWQLISAASTSTNDQGLYRLIGLSPGKYYLCAVYNGYTPPGGRDSYVPLCYPASTGVSAAKPVELSPGQEASHLDFDLKPIRTAAIRGLVSAATSGDPVPSANVVLMRRETPWSGSQMRSTTDATGHFELHAVPPGSYALLATWFDKGRLSSGRKTVEVASEDVGDVAVSLGQGYEIKGQVHVEGEAGSPLNLGTLRVNIQPLEQFATTPPGARVETSGAFVLRDVPAGSYTFSVCCPGGDFYVKTASAGSRDVLEQGLTVDATGAAEPIDVRLSPAGGHIEGKVIRDGKPFVGALVALVPEPDRRTPVHPYFNAASDEGGAFTLKGIPPGQYKVFAWERLEDGAYHDAETLRRYENLGKPVRVGEGDKLTVDVPLIPAANGQ